MVTTSQLDHVRSMSNIWRKIFVNGLVTLFVYHFQMITEIKDQPPITHEATEQYCNIKSFPRNILTVHELLQYDRFSRIQ